MATKTLVTRTTDPVVSWWVSAPRATWQTTYETEAVAMQERTPDKIAWAMSQDETWREKFGRRMGRAFEASLRPDNQARVRYMKAGGIGGMTFGSFSNT